MNCVPFNKAKPSFDCKTIGSQPNFSNTLAEGCLKPSKYTSPSPNNGNDKCANGAKSPEAPNEPCV